MFRAYSTKFTRALLEAILAASVGSEGGKESGDFSWRSATKINRNVPRVVVAVQSHDGGYLQELRDTARVCRSERGLPLRGARARS